MLATFAFDVCHEVYQAAREATEGKIATLNLESSGKYTWRPDRVPRLAEFVADFARAGERALGASAEVGRTGNLVRPPLLGITDGARAPSRTGRSACPTKGNDTHFRASRLVMFRMFYLGGAEYHAARRHLGISEFTWADWSDEIRARVGRELVRAGMFPPSKYFRASGAQEPVREKRELRATGHVTCRTGDHACLRRR